MLLVNTDAEYKYVGCLVVEFDSDGLVIPDSIDPSQSGAYATSPQGRQRLTGTPLPEVSSIADSLRKVLNSQDGNVFGKTGVFLNGIPGFVRTEETNLGNQIADANLWTARKVDPEFPCPSRTEAGFGTALAS